MFKGRIVPVQDKVKEIRLRLDVTQGVLAKGVCSRVNITNIEGGQTVTDEIAEKLFYRIMELSKEKGIYI